MEDVPNSEIVETYLDINKAFNNLVKLDADRLGITVVQLKTLIKLASNPNIGLGELADKLRLTKSTVSGVIERLVKIRLVKRVVPLENRRVVSICLTEKGKRLLDQFYSFNSTFKKLNIVFDLPEEEMAHLLRLQKLVLKNLLQEELG
jgi:MarR family transcriptional regulator, organic hydroperoxide resistance regulator